MISLLRDRLNARFGTWRGLVRLLLARAERTTGRLQPFELQDPQAVRRVVFVCLGNICRSAYAEQVARAEGLHTASLGLSTTTGVGSPDPALAAAARQQMPMDAHRARDWQDFIVQPGDLLLAMEVRQVHELTRRLGGRDDVQVALLGNWCSPPFPHLHDPFTLSDAYFDTCFARVRQAVVRLANDIPNARALPAQKRG
ncbi:arsenate reductase/protein-tyrosine-phosphatase family protein [Pseudoduganella umbonata]|uniref:protein-tyrosine-phosphatase n=1 Tax=Pseudoduganella umbonata TaxID=864828 RepID=A0A4P8HU02_9BURK|nr:phosphotyrosine protein phosphatase [Pseudoduganella umbonata]MBB3223829.1 protein-tyrosine phosphatase [Pseudoduganella umbonata]QCP12756.1 phosphotyrosine protein phosphatase [Pseudoduganella umbonata]